ncbi:MAG: hypothetical protein DI598_18390 [Pseudopedobacter saltans]|uniref:PBCV-specific basic adaptor domain-containing protein n=1 Tax=Pseudopedobacter saltans TaxID=151895 RepID=A0A2W5EJC3_9SPHI|nr:MAG: hypothetical protein DI598_18390 [Pseudopedobacter saltans]
MKKHLAIGFVALAFSSIAAVSNVSAQSKVEQTADKTGKAIGKGAKTVGNKSAELATKGFAKVKDKTYKGKVAPDGSDVYIDKSDKKYYLNKDGKKIYLKKSEIKDKPKD